MIQEFRLQDPGEGIHEAEIVDILVSAGDRVDEGQNVLLVETDKAAVELPAPTTGVVKDIKVDKGAVARVGDVLMTIDEGDGEAAKASSGESGRDTEAASEEDTTSPVATAQPETGSKSKSKAKPKPKQESKPEATQQESRKQETETRAETEAAEKEPSPATASGAEKGRDKTGRETKPAAPATRRMAREKGVDIATIQGSGPDGRVEADDVKRAGGRPAQAPSGDGVLAALAAEAPPLPDFDKWGETERVPLRSVRRATARRVALAWRHIPHVTHQEAVDITDLEAARRRYKDEIAQSGGRLSLTVLLLKAVAAALIEHPQFNASLDPVEESIVLKHYCHIGVATDSDRGLLVPVIRDVHGKSVLELARELPELVARVRDGKPGRADLTGGTFTITNVGPFGATGFTPIINYPEAAILGVASARLQPVFAGATDSLERKPRLMLPLCLAFDHRINDGADAGRFMATLKSILAAPDRFMLMT